ncbi:MAG: TrbG/VirB9 family P-type conjugative transfer protein [Sphingomonas sp.]|nr:TrbG/VirB9 family P-type conjugative transfer protein [Sphingomonas sp.]
MIRKFGFAALTLLACSVPAQAADNRIRTLAYDPEAIVKILGKAGIQSTIEFAADERIENVAVGDSSAWQITPNRRASLLFVKPLNGHSRTNMTVVTDRRTYMFDLVSGEKAVAPVYALKFSYPNDKPVEAPKPAQQAAAIPPQQQAVMTAEKLHFDWNKKGNGKLLPTRVFDDGASVYLAWDKETPLPAILTLSEDRKEGPVNYRMSGEYIVVSPIPQNLVLRYGRTSAVLWPSRRILPSAPAPVRQANVGQLAAASSVTPTPQQQAPAPAAAPTVKLANMTSLYSDQVTGNEH